MAEELTTKEKFAEALKKLNEQITAKDRKAYMDETKCAQPTLSNYMNGNVADLDKAAEMITFFKKRIEEREAILN